MQQLRILSKSRKIDSSYFKILNNKDIPIYGDGNHQREWIYVKMRVKIYILPSSNVKMGKHIILGQIKKTNLEIHS